jgi:hypothetical protein
MNVLAKRQRFCAHGDGAEEERKGKIRGRAAGLRANQVCLVCYFVPNVREHFAGGAMPELRCSVKPVQHGTLGRMRRQESLD